MLKDFLRFLCIVMSLLLFFIILIIAVGLGLECLDYVLNKAECNLYVEKKLIWSGRCHFINISSVGENGNTKITTVYKDIIKLKPLKVYVNNDIEVKEK